MRRTAHGVRVSALCPGAVETGILDAAPPPDLPSRTDATLTPRQYLSAIGQRPMAADEFARRALRQLARNRAHRLSPAATTAVNRLLATRVRKRMAGS